MTHSMQSLEDWAGILLAKLQPAQRRAVGRKIAIDLRRSQIKRIAAQTAPDGNGFIPRKPRKELRKKKGAIRRKKNAMFKKLNRVKHLTIRTSENQIAVGFFGFVERVARVHQYGLTDLVAKGGEEHRYAARPLLGFSVADRVLVREALVRYLGI